MIRRMWVCGSVVGLALALMAAPAFAHECYNASRSDTGNAQIAAHSPAFATFDQVAMGFFTDPVEGLGLCEAGATWLLGQIHANAGKLGVDLNWVVSTRTVQAQGLDHSPSARAQQNLSNGTGIDHLGENAALGAFIQAHAGDAFAMCD